MTMWVIGLIIFLAILIVTGKSFILNKVVSIISLILAPYIIEFLPIVTIDNYKLFFAIFIGIIVSYMFLPLLGELNLEDSHPKNPTYNKCYIFLDKIIFNQDIYGKELYIFLYLICPVIVGVISFKLTSISILIILYHILAVVNHYIPDKKKRINFDKELEKIYNINYDKIIELRMNEGGVLATCETYLIPKLINFKKEFELSDSEFSNLFSNNLRKFLSYNNKKKFKILIPYNKFLSYTNDQFKTVLIPYNNDLLNTIISCKGENDLEIILEFFDKYYYSSSLSYFTWGEKEQRLNRMEISRELIAEKNKMILRKSVRKYEAPKIKMLEKKNNDNKNSIVENQQVNNEDSIVENQQVNDEDSIVENQQVNDEVSMENPEEI